MKYDHYAHNLKTFVKEGDKVERGQLIALLGDSGISNIPSKPDAHCHIETWKVNPAIVGWNAYTAGMTKAQVLARYEDCQPLFDFSQSIPLPKLTAYGWKFLDKINKAGQLHPGYDVNAGVGDSDIGTEIRALARGRVIKILNKTAGWGNHLFIERSQTLSLKQDDMHRTHKGTVYALSAGFWVAIGTTGEQYLAEWQVSDFPVEMTDAQFKAFPVHKRVIK